MDLLSSLLHSQIQLLHCLRQASVGDQGANMLVDSLMVTEELKKQYPEYYKMLTTFRVRFNDVGVDLYGDFDLQFERPIIG